MRIALCAAPFGYGPVAKALFVAQELVRRGIETWFVGYGIAAELARRTSLFTRHLECVPGDEAAVSAFRDCAAVVVVMEPEWAAMAKQSGRPFFVVDSLFWMWDEVPREFLDAELYFVQDFVGVRERAESLPFRPSVVGPIVGVRDDTARDRGGIVLNFGGFENPFRSAADNAHYLDFVGSALLSPSFLSAAGRPVVCIGGEGCIRYLAERFDAPGVEMRSVSHEEADALTDRAGKIYTAPGLTTIMRAFSAGVPAFFLPPQNYSQWLILHRLRERQLAPHALHWVDCLGRDEVSERMPESESVPLVQKLIREVTSQPAAREEMAVQLALTLQVDRASLAEAQQHFARSLGSNGAETIVDALVQRLIPREAVR